MSTDITINNDQPTDAIDALKFGGDITVDDLCRAGVAELRAKASVSLKEFKKGIAEAKKKFEKRNKDLKDHCLEMAKSATQPAVESFLSSANLLFRTEFSISYEILDNFDDTRNEFSCTLLVSGPGNSTYRSGYGPTLSGTRKMVLDSTGVTIVEDIKGINQEIETLAMKIRETEEFLLSGTRTLEDQFSAGIFRLKLEKAGEGGQAILGLKDRIFSQTIVQGLVPAWLSDTPALPGSNEPNPAPAPAPVPAPTPAPATAPSSEATIKEVDIEVESSKNETPQGESKGEFYFPS